MAVGYILSLGTSRTVNAFGLYDAANTPGTGFQGDGLLSNNNEVNLWRVSDQALLATSASIPQSGADGSGYIYQSVYTPMNGFTGVLDAGTQYLVSARYNVTAGVSQNNLDAFRDSSPGGGGPSVSAGVSMGGGHYSGSGAFYQYPSNVDGIGFVGPNIDLAIAGDYNQNGIVDAADYVEWRKNNGTQTGYVMWRENFGQPGASGSGLAGGSPFSLPVPEPAAFVLALVAVMMGLAVRRR